MTRKIRFLAGAGAATLAMSVLMIPNAYAAEGEVLSLSAPEKIAGSFIVKLKEGKANSHALASRFGGTVEREYTSFGGFNVKLYAALYPEDVAGMVLVDPSEERQWDRTRLQMRKQFGTKLAARAELLDQSFFGWLMDRYANCAAEAKKGDLDGASIIYRRCSDPPREPLGPDIAAERARIQVKAKYQAAQASEIINSVYGDERGDAVYASLFRPGMSVDEVASRARSAAAAWDVAFGDDCNAG